MTVAFYQVRLRRVIALICVDTDNGDYLVVNCSNLDRCQNCGISCCPAYCEIVVAAKDFAYGRRRPKASVMEVEAGVEV